ncbi:flagellin lysine-N-methylase [Clostridium sp. D2Q-11]|uniref:Flagellin lysine-N-methylase n=1 Tax=Anaeromonas frigoriresistens TaxID=2683708 RepID=A0A942UUR0_9FIRM|nr:flagellin lysine-N-methylase [Anaeromonas frigoriresistens]MBS4538948.1 flagellin lysine-N-methylase [Anaeromonas frigoriresistens]
MKSNKEHKILQPKYCDKFRCNPIKCEESCCERWKIIIDKNTYKKYINSENEVIKKIVEKGLSRNEKSMNGDDFAIVNLNSEMMCPFLNQHNLCEIFINMGENSLSKTCKSYPRAIVLMEDEIERGLELSCSVAAELALLNDKGIELEEIRDIIEFDDLYVVSPLTKDLEQVEMIKEIRTQIINILQTRSIKLSERLEFIGYFLNEIVSDIDFSRKYNEESLSKIKEVNILHDVEKLKSTKKEFQFKNNYQFHHLNTILSMKFKEGDSVSFFSKRYIECLMQVLDVFSEVKDKNLENHYKINYEKYLKPYLEEKSYILENYLVNHVFIYSSELFNLNNIWNSYLKLCVIYGLLKLNLIGLATYHKGMNDDLALKLIQSLTKTFIQDKTYWQSVIKYLEKEKLVELNKLITLYVD